MPSSWKFVYMWGFKPHYVHPSLFEDLVQDLQERDSEAELDEELTGDANEAFCDLGGVVMLNEPTYEVDLGDGFIWATRARCFRYYLAEIEEAEVRAFASGKPYYKLHGWIHCVVITPEQYVTLRNKMREEAKLMSVVEDEVDKTWAKTVKLLNQHANVELPDPTEGFNGGGEWN